ncbi:F0F1 ATP synthase subunit delta [Maritimibacter sp. 55A14]|uniref:F0F1 ATP synthase subunit delta n=1 Tax=Maritimibacter sp. 55A14 TaxID=2174844 RepID=UPI000D60FCDC|nr:F0F1 ATP synthase subunit delta [Maritimibacter sp. 55A14]PWE32202.1 F0F1 ATP synthase subunit delta [Maritimibacter sp. 55A14]
MSESASISTGIASRYATALFELALEDKKLPALESDIAAIAEAMDSSADLRDMIASPAYTRDDKASAIKALAGKMEIGPLTANTLALMAEKGRLFVLPQLVSQVRAAIAAHKGEVTAEVRSAKPLTKAQSEKLAKTLKSRVGKDVKINATVDESLIGGLIVQVGSKMIDSSISSKLSKLQNAMKEVG